MTSNLFWTPGRSSCGCSADGLLVLKAYKHGYEDQLHLQNGMQDTGTGHQRHHKSEAFGKLLIVFGRVTSSLTSYFIQTTSFRSDSSQQNTPLLGMTSTSANHRLFPAITSCCWEWRHSQSPSTILGMTITSAYITKHRLFPAKSSFAGNDVHISSVHIDSSQQ